MLPYGFEGKIIVDAEEVDSADVWKQPNFVQDTIRDVIDRSKGTINQVGILTKDGAEKLIDKLYPNRHLSPEEQEAQYHRSTLEIVAAMQAKQGIDPTWFEEECGEPFDFEAYKQKLKDEGIDVD